MSSIFKNVMKSRRKRNKSRSTTPVNFNATKPSDRPSNSIYPSKKHPAQPLHFIKVSSTTDEDSPRNQDYDDHYPSRRRSKSFESPLDETPSKDTNKKNKFKGLRRKSKQPEPRTPDTVASSNGGDSPPVSKSEHDRLRSLQESYPSNSRNSWSFESSDTPCSNTTSLLPKNSHDRQRRKSQTGKESKNNNRNNIPDVGGNHTPNKPGGKRLIRMASSGDDKPLSDSRVHDKNNNNHDTTTYAGKRATAGTTKTVIMNGDIVLSNSYTSKSSIETATITSASSNSKAKAMRRKTERNARAAAVLDEKANDLFERGYFDKAMACYTKALKLKRRTFAHLLEESDDIDEELIVRDDSGNPVDAEALVSMATSINNIGYLRQRSGDATPEETMAAYKKSLRIKRRILGNDSLSVGKTLNNIGSVHYLKRDFEKALSSYNEALEIMKANLGDKHPDVATVMSNIGDVYLAQGDKTISVKYYRLALAIRWEAFGEKSPRTVRLLEKISNLEIGDMSQQIANTLSNKDFDDNASEVMAGSDYPPIAEGLRLLQESVKKDIARLDQMERDAAIENLRDKIIIIRGMRDCWNGSGPELLDNDSASVQTAMSRLSSR